MPTAGHIFSHTKSSIRKFEIHSSERQKVFSNLPHFFFHVWILPWPLKCASGPGYGGQLFDVICLLCGKYQVPECISLVRPRKTVPFVLRPTGELSTVEIFALGPTLRHVSSTIMAKVARGAPRAWCTIVHSFFSGSGSPRKGTIYGFLETPLASSSRVWKVGSPPSEGATRGNNPHTKFLTRMSSRTSTFDVSQPLDSPYIWCWNQQWNRFSGSELLEERRKAIDHGYNYICFFGIINGFSSTFTSRPSPHTLCDMRP